MRNESGHRRFILLFMAFTFAVVLTMPGAALTVLFKEIQSELHLTLVQVGLIWGSGSLPAMFAGTFAGAFIDRFGPRKVILAAIPLVGLATASRALAEGFPALLGSTLAFGFAAPLLTTSGFKIAGVWFTEKRRGLAYGILGSGIAVGLLLGSLLGATLLAPLLGDWRAVMVLFGAVDLLMVIPWLFLQPDRTSAEAPEETFGVPMHTALRHVLGRADLWLLGLAFLGISGSQQGIVGYLPLYLRDVGWTGAAADGAAAVLYAADLLALLPISMLSDRTGRRKGILLVSLVVMAAGAGLLAGPAGALTWLAAALFGMMRDASGSIVLTMAVEVEDIGPLYAGTASGFVMAFFNLGALVSPPAGNALAEGISPAAPFLLWTAMAVLAVVSVYFTGGRRRAHARRAQSA
jgi:CP family cyanate transporter-like MFS transporter